MVTTMIVIMIMIMILWQALFFTTDNGAHLQKGDERSSNQASNGLRQCKASLFEVRGCIV